MYDLPEKACRGENSLAYFALPQLKGKTQCGNITELSVVISDSVTK
jgi:hypothetical protein